MDIFTEISTKFEELREEQRMAIVNHFANNGFKVSKDPRAGKGKGNYTSGGTIAEYNLKNWKYVDVAINGRNVFISLQAFDKDPNSGNHHVLENRLGIYVYDKYNAEKAFTEMVTTNIDLPMNDEKFRLLDTAIDMQLRKVV